MKLIYERPYRLPMNKYLLVVVVLVVALLMFQSFPSFYDS